MKKLTVSIVLVAILAIVILNTCPGVESWLHQVTGWH